MQPTSNNNTRVSRSSDGRQTSKQARFNEGGGRGGEGGQAVGFLQAGQTERRVFFSSAFPAISLGFTNLGEGVFLFIDVKRLSPCDGMRAQTRPRFILSSESFWGMESEPMLTPREKSTLPEAQRRVEPTTLHHTGQRAQHTTD